MGNSIGDRRRGAGLARREEGAYLLVRNRRATQPDRMDRRRGRLSYPFAVPYKLAGGTVGAWGMLSPLAARSFISYLEGQRGMT